jgi:hypothetical protein
MKYILILSVLFLTCCTEEETTYRLDVPTHAQARRLTKLYITLGANNALGVSTPIKERLQAKYPGDNLYFVTHATTGTSLYNDWWPKETRTLSFNKACGEIDAALSQMPTPNEITVIWVQGERDAIERLWATPYLTNELMLEDSLRSRYAPLRKNGRDGKTKWKFINYLPVGDYPYLSTVVKAKEDHAGLRGNILISIPANEEYYTEGTYLTAAGISRFADLVAEQL